MKISILTTITNPTERQDKWKEALNCYMEFADQVVVVNGGIPLSVGYLFKNPKITIVDLEWPHEWNWIELPRHLNAGLKECTGDWVIKLDIDQLIHEKDFAELYKRLLEAPKDAQAMTMQKMSFTYGRRYFQKGELPLAFRREPEIVFGDDLDNETDLCFPIKQIGVKVIVQGDVIDNRIVDRVNYDLPIGRALKTGRTGVSYYNYDHFFKSKEFVKREFFRFSRAYYRYFGSWNFGKTEEESFAIFLQMIQARYEGAPYTYELKDHPQWIRKAVEELTPDQLGFNLWGL